MPNVETRIPAVELRLGDRVVFTNPENGRKVARELVHMIDTGEELALEFNAGRGRFHYRVGKDTDVLISRRTGGASRYVLA
jgi:hypothetical protein